MAGHEGGIVTFGKNFEDAFDVVMRERNLGSCLASETRLALTLFFTNVSAS